MEGRGGHQVCSWQQALTALLKCQEGGDTHGCRHLGRQALVLQPDWHTEGVHGAAWGRH